MKKFDKELYMTINLPNGTVGQICVRVNKNGIAIHRNNADFISDSRVIEFLNEYKDFRDFKIKNPNLLITNSKTLQHIQHTF